MIPPGYITLPEALDLIEACIDDDDLHVLQGPPSIRVRRWAAIVGLGEEVSEGWSMLSVYVMRGGKPSIVGSTDMKKLVDEGWRAWLEEGRVDAEACRVGDDVFGSKERPVTERYDGCQLLLHKMSVESKWKQQARLEPAKTGAPGRPSSMDLVLREFAGRLIRGETASSRDAESKELARWLAEKHPNMPTCTAKTILNRLPASFQPRNGRK